MSGAPTLFCPKCGQRSFARLSKKKRQCEHCRFLFYINAASAVAAVIRHGDEVLAVTRAREPGKGMLDLPGGFVDPGESFEQALHRELYEELGLQFEQARYLMSGANDYLYAGVLYHTADAFFEISVQQKPQLQAMDDVAALRWIALAELNLAEFAFKSQQEMFRRCYLV